MKKKQFVFSLVQFNIQILSTDYVQAKQYFWQVLLLRQGLILEAIRVRGRVDGREGRQQRNTKAKQKENK